MSEDALIKEINTLVEKDPDTVKALVAEFNKSQKFAKGGKIDHMVTKFQHGGNFYKNWSKEDIIRLQMFLASEDKLGEDRYQGEFDGIVGEKTINAIKAYQRKHGLKNVDGLWGYNTNLIHRPMLSSTLDKGSYKPNQKTDMG